MAVIPALPDVRARGALLDELEGATVDVVVVGAGITGAGVARELARRGVSVAVFDADDAASGTSSRSSKLIHGGLRYLAQGDVATVRRTARERAVVHRLAPHLAEPRWMVMPVARRRSLATFRAGVTTYEKLGGVDGADRHRVWDRGELAREEPVVDADRFLGAVAFREYVTDDARLVLANLRQAAAGGARVVTHCPVVELAGEAPRHSVVARCALTGRRIEVRCRAVVNAAGPWVDAVRRLEAPGDDRLVVSRGIHLCVAWERLPVRHMVALSAPDRRTLFAIRRDAVTYIGTTDTRDPAGPRWWPEITGDDLAYVAETVAATCAVAPLTPDDVTAAWAGLRPLIDTGEADPTEISRRDEVWVGPRGVVTVAGGKLTGYRLMALDVVEHLAALAGGIDPGRPGDETEPGGPRLPGGEIDGELDDHVRHLVETTGLAPDVVGRLARLYGSDVPEVLARGAEEVVPASGVMSGEVDWAVTVEGAADLTDLVYRRLRLAWFHPGVDALLEPLARRMGDLFAWSSDRITAEVAAVAARRRTETPTGREPTTGG